MTDTLSTRIASAECGSRELDAELWCFVHGLTFKKKLVVKGFPDRFYSFRTDKGDIGLHSDEKRGPVGHYSTSLDAALGLVERLGLRPYSLDTSIVGQFRWMLLNRAFRGDIESEPFTSGSGKTPALAVCLAILSAKGHAK